MCYTDNYILINSKLWDTRQDRLSGEAHGVLWDVWIMIDRKLQEEIFIVVYMLLFCIGMGYLILWECGW